MQDSTTSREKVLKKVRKALIHKTPLDIPDIDSESEIYAVPNEPLEEMFARAFSKINGRFIFCENEKELISGLSALIRENGWDNVFTYEQAIKELLKKGNINFTGQQGDIKQANVGITFCESLVARTGSLFVSSRQSSGRRLVVFPNYHIVIAYTSQLVLNIKDAIAILKAKYGANIPSMISCITGPSRTADIEKTLVQGAHGPKEIYVLLVDDTR